MKKGLYTALLATAAMFAGISSSYASAPVISSLPDVCIGDGDENPGGTDNNFFRFTNAFRFDDYVSDADSTVSELLWSFDEGDEPSPGGTDQYFTINGNNPIHVGAVAAAGGDPLDHLNPGADELRADGEWADFRDIVLSPGPGTGPFTPSPGDLAQHDVGKVVTFWVSDGTNVTSQSIVVNICDNENDQISGGFIVTWENVNDFTSAAGWVQTRGNSVNPLMTAVHDTTNGELDATVGPNSLPTNFYDGAWSNNHRIIGWLEGNQLDDGLDNLHLSYGEAGTNFVRVKYSLYASGVAGDLNKVPNLRLRVTSRFAFGAVVDVLHHQFFDTANNPISDDLTPSTNSGTPSVYRVDMDPPETLPYVVANPNEGLQRMWEAFAPGYEPVQEGTINMTESSIGTYPAYDLTSGANLVKTYTGADFAQSNIYYLFEQYARGPTITFEGRHRNSATPESGTNLSTTMQATGSASNVTLRTAGVSDTKIAIVAVDFLEGTVADLTNHTLRVRAEEDKVYAVSYRITSTTPATQSAWYRLRVRSVKFGLSSRLELDGAWNQAYGTTLAAADLTRPGHLLAQQYAPTSTPKIYTVLVHSPLDNEIGAQPQLNAESGPGAGAATPTQASRRDIFPGADIIDSISGEYYVTPVEPDFAEKGHLVIDRIEIRTFDRASD